MFKAEEARNNFVFLEVVLCYCIVVDLEFGDRSKFKVQSWRNLQVWSRSRGVKLELVKDGAGLKFKEKVGSSKSELGRDGKWMMKKERGREKVKKLRLFIPLARNLGYPRITHSDVNRPITPNIKINIQSQLSHFGDRDDLPIAIGRT